MSEMKMVLAQLGEFSADNKVFIQKSVVMTQKVLNWQEWQNRVKAVTSFAETKKLGPEVLGMMAGADVVINLKEMDSMSSTIGYTYLHGKFIWLNEYFVTRYRTLKQYQPFEGLARVSGCLVHETQHVEGFTHDLWFHKDDTVPYKMQHIWEKAFVEYYSDPNRKARAEMGLVEKSGIEFNLNVEYRLGMR